MGASLSTREAPARDLKSRRAPSAHVLYVKTLTGKRIELTDWDYSDAVDRLRLCIQDKEGIPPSQQRLVFGGETLEGWRQIGSYGISKECSLHLVLRTRSYLPPAVLVTDNRNRIHIEGGSELFEVTEAGRDERFGITIQELADTPYFQGLAPACCQVRWVADSVLQAGSTLGELHPEARLEGHLPGEAALVAELAERHRAHAAGTAGCVLGWDTAAYEFDSRWKHLLLRQTAANVLLGRAKRAGLPVEPGVSLTGLFESGMAAVQNGAYEDALKHYAAASEMLAVALSYDYSQEEDSLACMRRMPSLRTDALAQTAREASQIGEAAAWNAERLSCLLRTSVLASRRILGELHGGKIPLAVQDMIGAKLIESKFIEDASLRLNAASWESDAWVGRQSSLDVYGECFRCFLRGAYRLRIPEAAREEDEPVITSADYEIRGHLLKFRFWSPALGPKHEQSLP